ncbi:DNA replication/repair protein RecF [Companilactobacillus mishanensis]|uniref:DNA replication and repair protein RecF n=1 Tax=Companilactobacillus mishanensis TaxID=2486008 RepID=A0ABW9P6W5_9LACO|nr:DNA replication/repair protein RecF [Companilactobacillus mishanensis]MQS45019.1 DNA replication/repair protein RecF [Companilactobacillus mishanensis]MQS90311.1 DNA replication/repair protein RecF [Companilactobacillus mishanensis]
MYIKSLQLQNYRNYEALEAEFSPNINVFLGQNAQGKTNLLEAMYFLALTRSHRTSNDKDLIKWGSDFARISGTVIKDNSSRLKMNLVISKSGKKAKLNNLEQRKLSSYIGNLNVVLFSPEDLSIVKGNPSIRRKFVDMEFGQISSQYLKTVSQFRLVLKQRNAYLKKLQHHQTKDLVYLDVLSDQLSAYCAEVIMTRLTFLKRLQVFIQKIHSRITDDQEVLQLQYSTFFDAEGKDVEALYNLYKDTFKKNYQKEIQRGVTLFGPHRDDIKFLVNDKNVQDFGSQGQQRSVALSLKLAEVELIKEEVGDYPILLLDDVLSELDHKRQTHLLASIGQGIQTFITTTSLEDVDQTLIKDPNVLQIIDGKIKQEEI